MHLKDDSITSPELLLKLFNWHVPVPEIIVIASKGVTKNLAESADASEVALGFDSLYVGKVERTEILICTATRTNKS